MMIKRAMLAMLGLVLLVSVGVRAADLQKDEAMLGTWTVVFYEVDGKVLEAYNGNFYEFSAGNHPYLGGLFYTFSRKGEPDEEGFYTIDATKNPKWLDISNTYTLDWLGYSDVNWYTYRGIYKLEGDRLTLSYCDCLPERRPTEFKSAGGNLMVLQRLKK